MQRKIHWLALLVICTILLTIVIANPANKYSSKYKKSKYTAFHKKFHSKVVTVKSRTDALKFFTQLGFNKCKYSPGSRSSRRGGSRCRPTMESMLEAFQIAFHLPVTKKLDAATLKLINTPRCSLSDSPPSFIDKSKLWPTNRTLTWKLDQDQFFYESSKTRQYIQQAFDDWAEHTQLTFREVTGQEHADFNLAFAYGYHGDNHVFDGRGGVLAHAFYPWDIRSGQIHFDPDEKWSNTYDGMGHNFRLVAAHEIGHSLGLAHTHDSGSLMFKFYQIMQPEKILPEQDRVAIQSLYGTKQQPVTASYSRKIVQTTTTTTTTTQQTTTTMQQTTIPKKVTLRSSSIDIHPNAKWVQNGLTVAGGNGEGNATNQLDYPTGLYVDDDQTIYVTDQFNHRIVQWKEGATSGQVVAGGNGQGNGTHQLDRPYDVIVDKDRYSLIVCDRWNDRVVRWPLRNGTSGETIISNIDCAGLTMDDKGSLYVVDNGKHEVRRYRMGDIVGTVVAGGNGRGSRLDQFHYLRYVFVDGDHSVYVSDWGNHRVMKWEAGAKEGIVVAGGQEKGNRLSQLASPRGVVVDQLGTVYVADFHNHRIMRWSKGETQGSVVAGGNGYGAKSNQLYSPKGLSFDRRGNLYVSDYRNRRVQKFNIE